MKSYGGREGGECLEVVSDKLSQFQTRIPVNGADCRWDEVA
jgi:hypothetical protein